MNRMKEKEVVVKKRREDTLDHDEGEDKSDGGEDESSNLQATVNLKSRAKVSRT